MILSISTIAEEECVVTPDAPSAKNRRPCVVCWSENTAPKDVYPNDINAAVAAGLGAALPGWDVVVAGLDDEAQGLPEDVLQRCDVLVWWGHQRHGQVTDALCDAVVARVRDRGMGFVSLHSSHFAKPNIALMSHMPTDPAVLTQVQPINRVAAWGNYLGDSVELNVIVTEPAHPIAAGVPASFTISHHERYNDPYAVPPAEAIVFVGDATLTDGKVDRSQLGFCWTIGKGRMFYFQAGHETDPVFFDAHVRTIVANAVRWTYAG